ncbi:MAG: hypothetical protein RLN76_11465 [Phycisphaeraceae bacterium]
MAAPALALDEDNVLVVYNSAQADSVAVYNHYLTSRPGVLGFDLNDPTVTGSTFFDYADYTGKLRDPIRDYLTTNNLQEQVAVITLTKGIPHRIDDRNTPSAGNNPPTAVNLLNADNATYASVDSELTLLWQDTETGEANGPFDSASDNFVANPYWNSTSKITDFDRSTITNPNSFQIIGGGTAYRMREPGGTESDAGDMLLTSRLDGYSIKDVLAMIDRAKNPIYNTTHYTIVVDENSSSEFDDAAFNGVNQGGDDFDDFVSITPFFYDAVEFDDNGAEFLVGEETAAFLGTATNRVVEGPVAALITYGGNHNSGNADNRGFINTWSDQLVDGAIYNSVESFSARNFNGINTGFNDQGQLADWIAAGGTFGLGSVYEPFTFGIADNEMILPNFLLQLGAFQGLTWVEAAWSGIPYLSWQNMVLGDPLARATIVNVNLGDVPGDIDLNAMVNLRDLELLATLLGDPAFDLDGDLDTDADDIAFWVRDIFGSELGDTNLDFKVDLVDLSTLATHFGATDARWSLGDFNGDAVVDLIDLSLLASAFGFDIPAAAPLALPEPASALLLGLPALLLSRR